MGHWFCFFGSVCVRFNCLWLFFWWLFAFGHYHHVHLTSMRLIHALTGIQKDIELSHISNDWVHLNTPFLDVLLLELWVILKFLNCLRPVQLSALVLIVVDFVWKLLVVSWCKTQSSYILLDINNAAVVRFKVH